MSHPAATPQFWHDRWSTQQIGFHLTAPNPSLLRWWPTLNLPFGARVLVPLCGKSHDLGWLAEQGHEVVGVELSAIACAAFFEEAGVVPQRETCGAFEVWRAGRVTIYQGDIFGLAAVAPLSGFDAVWDRAALIALPPDVRDRYLREIRVPGPHLVVTMTYDQERRDGPPFSVPDSVVLGAWPQAKRLASEPLSDERFAQSGGVSETVWRTAGDHSGMLQSSAPS